MHGQGALHLQLMPGPARPRIGRVLCNGRPECSTIPCRAQIALIDYKATEHAAHIWKGNWPEGTIQFTTIKKDNVRKQTDRKQRLLSHSARDHWRTVNSRSINYHSTTNNKPNLETRIHLRGLVWGTRRC